MPTARQRATSAQATEEGHAGRTQPSKASKKSSPSGPGTAATRDRVLDIAERLVQTRGFNAWSYADIAAALGITKASLHYHFPTKADLGARLIARYEETFLRALHAIDASGKDPLARLEQYMGIYESVLRDDRLCLCGMLAAEQGTLPPEMKAGLRSFFDANEAWLAALLEEGRERGELHFEGKAEEQANSLVGSLEGAMLVARLYEEVARFTQMTTRLLAMLRAPRASAARRAH